MSATQHDRVIEQFGADRTDEALGEGVRLRGTDRCQDHPRTFDRNTSSKVRVIFASRSRRRNRISSRLPVIARSLACWATHRPIICRTRAESQPVAGARHSNGRALGWRLGGAAFEVALVFLAIMAVQPTAHAAQPRATTSSDPVIAAAGDIACDPADPNFNGGNGTANYCHEKKTSDLLVAGGFTAVLPLGDEQYECGGAQAFAQSYDPTWGRVKSISYPAVGNHEYYTSGGTDCATGATGYFDYFGAAAHGPGGYYSYDIGTWHLIVLNSNCQKVACSAGSAQEQWLAADLADHPADCTLAYFHHPLFSASSSPGGATNGNVQPFWEGLYAAHADLVLNGHKHHYERLARLSPAGTPDADGIREFVVGTGGENLGGGAYAHEGTQVYDTSQFGVLELTLHPGSYDWRMVADTGAVIDSGSDPCVGEITPPPTISGFSPQSGPVATPVTVSGTGFTGATAVAFNGTAAQYTVTDDSTIQTSVPQGATTGPISVTTTGGAATSSSDFTVTAPPPPPTISGFSPEGGAVGTQVIINGTGFTGATTVAFNGTTAGYTVTDDSTIQTSVPQGATTGPMSVTTPGGTATTSSDFIVTGPPPPTLVQHILAKGPGATAPTATWPQATAGGDLLVASLGWTGSGSPVPPPGWTPAAKIGGTALYYLPNAASQSGGVSFSGSNLGGWILDLMEWSGMAPAGTLDRTATHTTGSVTSTIADSGTTSPTSQPSEVAIGAIRALASLTQSNPTDGFTVVDAGTQTSSTLGMYSKDLAATGPQGFSVTLSKAARSRGLIATFRGA